MELICPNCAADIKADNVNIATDLAKCDKCNTILKASDLVNSQSAEKIGDPPAGAKIVVKKGYDDTIELFYPKRGITLSAFPQMIFLTFWLSFIFIFGFVAVSDEWIMVIFLLPFLAFGTVMFIGLINSISETQTLKIGKDILTVVKNRPVKSLTFVVAYKDVQAIRMKTYNNMNFLTLFANLKHMSKMGLGGVEMPAIISGFKTVFFFEDANDAEQEWVTKAVDGVLKRKKTK